MTPREHVEKMFKSLSTGWLVKIFNENVADPRMFTFPYIYTTDNQEEFDKVIEHYGIDKFIEMLQDAICAHRFDRNDKFWLFDEDAFRLYSFSTPEKLFEAIPVDTFVNEFECQPYTRSSVRPSWQPGNYTTYIKKCGYAIAGAVITLPMFLCNNVVTFYRDDEKFQITLPECPKNWNAEQCFDAALKILNRDYPMIPWE